jgi:hypothetical protein
MDNVSLTSGEQQLLQPILEALQKLIEAGSPPETISFVLGIDIEQIRKLIAKDPKQLARVVETIREKSVRYRCAQSNRMMLSPVIAVDGNYYEHCILQAHPSLSGERVMPHPKLKAEIAKFSKDSLEALEHCLHQREPQQGVYELIAECLSVLSLESDLESVLMVLGTVEGKGVKNLTEKLSDLVSGEYLLSLMNQTARPLPYQTLCLARLVILHPLSERAFEEAFSCFTEQLSQVSLSPGVVELAEEVSERLSSSKLGQLNSVLERQPRDKAVEDKLDRLRLKEAYQLLREGDTKAAVSLVSSLHSSQHLEEEVLKFYEEAGWVRGKVKMLKHKLSTSVEALSQESPSVAATIRILSQLLDTELLSLRSETQEFFAKFRAEGEVVNEALAKAGSDAKQVEAAQHLQVPRLEKQFQESFANLKAELNVLHEIVAKERNEIMQTNAAQFADVQRFLLEQSKMTEAATHKSIDSLREEVDAVHEAVANAGSESATRIKRLDEQSERRESAYQESFVSLKGELETLKQKLTEALRLFSCTKEEAAQDKLPTFIYSYKQNTDQLYETSLATGATSSYRLPSYTFKEYCCWTELPGSGTT